MSVRMTARGMVRAGSRYFFAERGDPSVSGVGDEHEGHGRQQPVPRGICRSLPDGGPASPALHQPGENERGESHDRDRDQEGIGSGRPSHSREHEERDGGGSADGDRRRESGIRSEKRQSVAGESQGGGGGRGGLGGDEQPSGRVTEPRAQKLVAVLVGSARDRVSGGELSRRESVEGGHHRCQRNRDQNQATGIRRGDGDRHEHSGSENRPKTCDHSAEESEVSS